MKTRMLFIIQNMKRSEESVALLERLYRLSPEQYEIDLLVLSGRRRIAEKLTAWLPVKQDGMYGKLPTYINLLNNNINYIKNCKYDTAASFSDGKAAAFVAEQVRAEKKYLFLFHSNESEKGFRLQKRPSVKKGCRGRGLSDCMGKLFFGVGKCDKKHQEASRNKDSGDLCVYDAFDHIYTANFAVKAAFLRKYPSLSGRTFILPETIHWDRIERLARYRGGFADTDFDGIRILSIEQIGIRGHFDLALAAARELKKRGFYFRWYLIGGGIGLLRLKLLVRRMEIEDCVFLLGKQANPYPYIGQCDLYAAIGNAGKSVVGNIGNAALGNVVSEYAGIAGALVLDKYVVATDDVQAHCRMLEWEEDALLVEPLPNVFVDAVEYVAAEL